MMSDPRSGLSPVYERSESLLSASVSPVPKVSKSKSSSSRSRSQHKHSGSRGEERSSRPVRPHSVASTYNADSVSDLRYGDERERDADVSFASRDDYRESSRRKEPTSQSSSWVDYENAVRQWKLAEISKEDLRIQKDAEIFSLEKKIRKSEQELDKRQLETNRLRSMLQTRDEEIEMLRARLKEAESQHGGRSHQDGSGNNGNADYNHGLVNPQTLVLEVKDDPEIHMAILSENAELRRNNAKLTHTIRELIECIQQVRLKDWKRVIKVGFVGMEIPNDIDKLLQENTRPTRERDGPAPVTVTDLLHETIESQRVRNVELSSEFEKMKNRLEENLSSTNMNYQHLQKTVVTLTTTHNQLREKHEALLNEHHLLQTTFNDLQSKYTELHENHNRALLESEQRYKELFEDHNQKVKTMEEEKMQLRREAAKAGIKLSEAQSSESSAKETIKDLKDTLARYEDQIVDLEKRIDTYKDDIERSQEEFRNYRQAQMHIHDLNEKNLAYLKEVITKATGVEISDAESGATTHEKALELTNYINKIEKELKTMKAKYESDMQQLTSQHNTLLDIKTQMEADLQMLETEAEEGRKAKNLVLAYKDKLDQYHEQLTEAVEEIKQKDHNIRTLMESKMSLEQELSSTKNEVVKHVDTNRKQRVEMQKKNAMIQDWKAKFDELMEIRHGLESKIKGLNATITAKENLLKELRSKITSLNAELEHINHNLEETESLRQLTRKQKTEMSRKDASIKALKDRQHELEREVEGLVRQREELTNSQSVLGRQCEQIKKTMAERVAEVENVARQDVSQTELKFRRVVEEMLEVIMELKDAEKKREKRAKKLKQKQRQSRQEEFVDVEEDEDEDVDVRAEEDDDDFDEDNDEVEMDKSILKTARNIAQKILNVDYNDFVLSSVNTPGSEGSSRSIPRMATRAPSDYRVQQIRNVLRNRNFNEHQLVDLVKDIAL